MSKLPQFPPCKTCGTLPVTRSRWNPEGNGRYEFYGVCICNPIPPATVPSHTPEEIGADRRFNGRLIIAVLIIAAIFTAARCFAGIPEQVAIAEAEYFVQADRRRELPSDFDTGASGHKSTDGPGTGNAPQTEPDIGRSLVIDERDRLKAEVDDLRHEAKLAKDNLKAKADELARLTTPRESKVAPSLDDASRGLSPKLMLVSPVGSAPKSLKFGMAMTGPDWCGTCAANDLAIRKALVDYPGIKYTHYVIRDGFSAPRAVQQFVNRHGSWPVWQVEDIHGNWWMVDSRRSLDELIELHETGEIKGKPRVASAVGRMGSLSGMSARVSDALSFWSAYVNGDLTFIWDSNRNNGTGSGDGFAILNAKASDWTEERVYGTFGQFSILCPGGIKIGEQLFERLDITYKTVGDKVEILTSFAIDKAALVPGPKAFGAVQPSKVIDPGTALFIFNFLRAAWEIAHPELDLQLPGRMMATIKVVDGKFNVDFNGSPRIRAKAYWEWMLGVKGLVVSPENAHLDFLPQPGYWFQIHSRDVSLN